MRKILIYVSNTYSKYKGKVSKFITERRTIFAKRQPLITEHLYLKDIPVSSRKEDKFQYAQMADLIYELLEQGQLPLHVGLLGSWGTGKTSVLKILEARVNAGSRKKQSYFIKFINVWKFADDAPSLHRKIVREVEAQLKVENNEGIIHETSSQLSKKTSGIWTLFDKKNIKRYGFLLISYIITILLITILYEWLFNIKDPWALAYTNITSLLILMISYAFINKSSLEITNQETTKELALHHGDQFEHRFEKAVTQYLKVNKGKRLILVFDDLDRLPPKQLVAALNTIKTFLRSNQCAFIIPCDEANLHEGISNAFSDKNMSNFSVTEFLNKTFDLQLHLPFVEKINMRSFAKGVLKEQKIKWSLHPNVPMDRVLGVLIHTGIKTPRQVKKILNAYAFDWYLAQKRDLEAGIDFLSRQPLCIAIFTVLKTDFPKYFQIISQEPSLLNTPFVEQLKKIKTDISDGVEETVQHLESFLSRIETIMPNDPRPFIYFNNQLLNPLTGRPELEKTKEYLINGQSEKFNSAFFILPDSDKRNVISASLEDIDVTDGILVENSLKLLIDYNEALRYIDEMDLQRWEKLILENIDLLDDFEVLQVCISLKNIGVSDSTWESYGNRINIDEGFEELVQLWMEYPNYLEALHINDVGNKIIVAYKNSDKAHLLANIINSVDSNNHTLLDNNNFNWLDVLVNSILSDNLPEIPLSEWLKEWSNKTGEILTCKIINNLLDEFSFSNEEYLEGIGELWVTTYGQDPSHEDLNKLLSLMSDISFTGFSNEDLIKITEFFEDSDYATITKYVNKIFSTWWKKDEDKTINLLKIWKSTPGAAMFSSSIFSLELNEEKLYLVSNILRDRADRVPKDNTVIEKINNAILTAQTQNQRTPAVDVVGILVQNATWKKKMDSYLENWFPQNNTTIWLSWHEFVVRDRIELFQYLSNTELNNWMLRCIFDLFRVQQNVLGASGGYTNYARHYLNILLDRILDNDSIDWEEELELLVTPRIDGNNNTILSILDVPVIDKMITELNRCCSMDNKIYNQLLVENFTLGGEHHLEAVIKRWEYMGRLNRQLFTQKISGNTEQFGLKLVQYVAKKPNLEYIDELRSWGFESSTVKNLINTIISNVDIDSINSWIQSVFVELIESMDKWKFEALQVAIRTRKGLVLPDISILEEALRLNDERSKISLELLKSDKKTALSLKGSIMPLHSIFPDEVEEIRKKFRWRKV